MKRNEGREFMRSLFGAKAEKMLLPHVGYVEVPDTADKFRELAAVIASKLPAIIPTEQDNWWFIVEQFDRTSSFEESGRKAMMLSPLRLREIEYAGRRSEQSYVGAPNPGVAFFEEITNVLERRLNRSMAELVVANAYIVYVLSFKGVLDAIRMKYAVHFHNNCVANGSLSSADHWHEVITDLGGD